MEISVENLYVDASTNMAALFRAPAFPLVISFNRFLYVTFVGVFVTASSKQSVSPLLWRCLPSVGLTPQGCGVRPPFLSYKRGIFLELERSLVAV